MDEAPQQSILKLKEGQFVTLQVREEGLKLCAVDLQTGYEPLVYIKTRVRQKKNQVALCFKRDDVDYFPKVDGRQLIIDKIPITDNLTESHWFEKINQNGGEHYGLQSVGKPNKYLSMSADDNGNRTIFCLGGSEGDCVQLTDKAKAQSYPPLVQPHFY